MGCQNNIKDSLISHDILKTLLYFDIFHYPLNFEEITNFSIFFPDEIEKELDILRDNDSIYKIGEYYALSNDVGIITRRIKGNKLAGKVIKNAKIISYFISQFPFVRGVFVSGSLSKGFFTKNDDIDFFILTENNRLWVSRTLMIAFKKVFLLNSKKYFCVNYFKSTNALEIEEQNRFTATELATLIPFYCNGDLNKFYRKNEWVLKYFPNYLAKDNLNKPLKNSILKIFFEFLLQGSLGDYLETYCMNLTVNHQKKKFRKMNPNDFKIAFKGTKTTSKHHPDNHQKKVISLLNNKISAFNKEHFFEIELES